MSGKKKEVQSDNILSYRSFAVKRNGLLPFIDAMLSFVAQAETILSNDAVESKARQLLNGAYHQLLPKMLTLMNDLAVSQATLNDTEDKEALSRFVILLGFLFSWSRSFKSSRMADQASREHVQSVDRTAKLWHPDTADVRRDGS